MSDFHGAVHGDDEVSVYSSGDKVIMSVIDGGGNVAEATLESEHAMVLAGALERAAQRALRNIAARRDMEAYDKNLAREVYGD